MIEPLIDSELSENGTDDAKMAVTLLRQRETSAVVPAKYSPPLESSQTLLAVWAG